jgi:hypothetical protein
MHSKIINRISKIGRQKMKKADLDKLKEDEQVFYIEVDEALKKVEKLKKQASALKENSEVVMKIKDFLSFMPKMLKPLKNASIAESFDEKSPIGVEVQGFILDAKRGSLIEIRKYMGAIEEAIKVLHKKQEA